MYSLKRLVVVAGLTVVLAGCLHHRPPIEPSDDTPATLHVENHNWQEVDIQVVHRGLETHLGSVGGVTTTDIVFPRNLLGDLGEVQLIAHAIGTPDTTITPVIVLKPGTEIRWILENNLSQSTVSVH